MGHKEHTYRGGKGIYFSTETTRVVFEGIIEMVKSTWVPGHDDFLEKNEYV